MAKLAAMQSATLANQKLEEAKREIKATKGFSSVFLWSCHVMSVFSVSDVSVGTPATPGCLGRQE